MGSKFSKKKQGYDIDKANKGGGKKSRRSGRLNRRWKSVDVYTQTGDDEANVVETAPRVKATVSMDDLRDGPIDNKTFELANGRKKTCTSSSEDSSDDASIDKKKKKKKRKMKKSKDKKNKNNDNEKKKKNKKVVDEMETAVVINVSDVSDLEENARHSAIMVNNPVYQSADLPAEHRIKTSSSSSSEDEKEPKQPSGDDLANEILEVVSSVQLIHDIEESMEIESLPEPPPVPQRTEEYFHEEYEALEKVQFRSKRRSSSSSSSSDEEKPDVEEQILDAANDIDLNDVEIVYENAILKADRDEPIAVPYAEEVPKSEPEVEEFPRPEPEVEEKPPTPEPHFIEVRKISRSRSSSSSSSSSSDEDEEMVIVPVPEIESPSTAEEPPKDRVFEEVLIATAIAEDEETSEIPREPEAPIIQEVIIDSEPPEIPEKPARLRRPISSSSSSSSSADEGELVISEEMLPPPPPPVEDDPPVVDDKVLQMAEAISHAIVVDTMEDIKVEAVLLSPKNPEPFGETSEIEFPKEEPEISPPQSEINHPEPGISQPEPEMKINQSISRKSSTSSSSRSSSSSDSD